MIALQTTSKQLDGILSDLSREASRKTTKYDAEDDDDDYDSDAEAGGEHGERELRAELDSIVVTPWQKYLTDPREEAVSSESHKSVVCSLLKDKDLEKQEEEQQGDDSSSSPSIMMAPPECAPETFLPPPPVGYGANNSTIEIPIGSSDDGARSSGSEKNNTSSRRRTSTRFKKEQHGATTIQQPIGFATPSLSSTKSPKMLCLRLTCALLSIAALIGVAVALFAHDGDASSSMMIKQGDAGATTSSLELGSNNSNIVPSPTPATTILDEAGDFVGIADRPAIVAPTVSPTRPPAPSTLSPTTTTTTRRPLSTAAPTLLGPTIDGQGFKGPKKNPRETVPQDMAPALDEASLP